MKQASLAEANRLYFSWLRQKNSHIAGAQKERPDESTPGEQADEQGLDPTADEQAHRQAMMDAIEAATGKRPGVNTKTKTLEKRYAELPKE